MNERFDNDRPGSSAGDDSSAFEHGLRGLLAEDAEAVRPAAVPYPEIVRQGRQQLLRRRLAVAGAALAVLAVVPATAIALNANDGGASQGTQTASAPTKSPAPPSPHPSKPTGPTAPATPGQLADGLTMTDAATGLEQCLAWDRKHALDRPGGDLGKSGDYRILLAQRSTGNDNSPGDGHYIVAVRDAPTPARLICSMKNGEPSGISTSIGRDEHPTGGAVAPDINGGKLYLQRLSAEGPWKLPYRWGSIGTVDTRVARVTATYGNATVEAALDHGWYAATGVLNSPVTKAPRIKGYDAQGKEIYDSDRDNTYDKPLP
ncbi:hypothetical protein [Streptomyces sp. NPDC089799]|uniref:hypothetical protein n=1 Tax=Streptomyces sp. NPDC089799 TaxID=3155066 RepID=UPI00342572C6